MKLNLAGKRLAAALAVVVGLVGALAASIAHGTGAGPVDASALVANIVAEKDHVTPRELAQWIIDKKQDYQLVDIRDPWQFDDYHIPGAINIPLPGLFEDAGLKQLARDKTVVLYGLGAGHAAQAQLLLGMKGYRTVSLREGISAWWQQVMTPTSLLEEGASSSGYQQARALRSHFWGTGQAAPVAAPGAAPVRAPPPTTQPQTSQPQRLKLGRGCS